LVGPGRVYLGGKVTVRGETTLSAGHISGAIQKGNYET
jgi:hypothetical protein